MNGLQLKVARLLQVGSHRGCVRVRADRGGAVTVTDFSSTFAASIGILYRLRIRPLEFSDGRPSRVRAAQHRYRSATPQQRLLQGSNHVYTYVLDVTLSVLGERRVSTRFLPTLFGDIAGWNYTSAIAAGAPGDGSTASP